MTLIVNPRFDSGPAHTRATVAAMDRPPKLLDQLREALHARHYSVRTERAYCAWVRRFIYFHHVRHPAEMGEPEINTCWAAT